MTKLILYLIAKNPYSTIKRFEYYRMTSFRSWLNVLTGICPHCVFVVYSNYVIETKEFAGYLSFSNMKRICEHAGIDLKVY